MIKLNASNNKIRKMFDFDPPANLEWVDYSYKEIMKIENAHQNKYIKYLNLDENHIIQIEGLQENTNLRVLSLHCNSIDTIENLD
jgi:Leucine-rich repeat (LRR) protein